MRIGRAIFAVLIGLSVAMLPATIGIAAGVATATEISAAQKMPDCDHHHNNMPNGQTQKTADGCAYPAGCALCFAFVVPGVSGVAYAVSFNTRLDPVLAATNISSLMGSPPFRPPRA